MCAIFARTSEQPRDGIFTRTLPEDEDIPAPEKKGWPGIYSDLKKAGGSIPSGLLHAAINAPSTIGQFGKQAFLLPFEELNFLYNTAKNGYNPEYLPKLTANAIKGTIDTANLPSRAINYAGKKGFIPEEQGNRLRINQPNVGLKPEEENPLSQALNPFSFIGGRAISPFINKTLEKIPRVSSKGIAAKIAADKAAIKQTYTGHYNKLFEDAAAKGISTVSKPKINLKTIEDSGMPTYHKALEQFMQNPTLENAHWARSGLGQLERKLESLSERQGLTPPQNKAYRETKAAKQKIENAMFAEHKLGSQPALAKRYSYITKGYKNDVVPFNSAIGLKDFLNGELKAKDFTSKLYGNKKFMAQLGGKYPQLKLNQLSKDPWLRGALASALGIETINKVHETFR